MTIAGVAGGLCLTIRSGDTRPRAPVEMTIDNDGLKRLRRYEDPEAGVAEEFLERRLGPGRSLALLSAPLAEARPLGWVISPSGGPEHGNLRRLETQLARGLAAAGFPTLRIRPDLHPINGALGEIDVSARVADVNDGIAALLDETGVRSIGLVGMLFGGTVAALVAEQASAAGLALVEPVSRGKRYIRETLRRQAVAELMASFDESSGGEVPSEQEPSNPGSRPLEELAATGHTSVRGLGLSQEEYERISEIDLLEDVRTFSGRSLLVGISPSGTASPGLAKLRAHLDQLGGTVALEVLTDPLPAPFGEYFYRNAGPIRVDTRLELDERITAATVAWAVGAFTDDSQQAAA